MGKTKRSQSRRLTSWRTQVRKAWRNSEQGADCFLFCCKVVKVAWLFRSRSSSRLDITFQTKKSFLILRLDCPTKRGKKLVFSRRKTKATNSNRKAGLWRSLCTLAFGKVDLFCCNSQPWVLQSLGLIFWNPPPPLAFPDRKEQVSRWTYASCFLISGWNVGETWE